MRLEQYLKKELSERVDKLERSIEDHKVILDSLRKASDRIEQDNISNENYLVFILWSDKLNNKKGVTTEGRGSLKDIIKQAEKEFEFKSKGDATDIRYDIYLFLEDSSTQCFIPEEYWKKFAKYEKQ